MQGNYATHIKFVLQFQAIQNRLDLLKNVLMQANVNCPTQQLNENGSPQNHIATYTT